MNKALVLGGAVTAVGVDVGLGTALRGQPLLIKGTAMAAEFAGATGLMLWGKGNIADFGLGALAGLTSLVTLFALSAVTSAIGSPMVLNPGAVQLLAPRLRQQPLVAFGVAEAARR